jgi:hypothetical protein
MVLPRAGFEYPDRIDSGAIRILGLQPAADFHSRMQCSLTTHRRTECGSYEALSYCLGIDDQRFESMVVNGGACILRRQLVAALQHL